MIYGIGHDIVDINRVGRLLDRYGTAFINKILTSSEQELLVLRKCKYSFLSTRFAAKEAFSKACGTGLRFPVMFSSISILNGELGEPIFRFSNKLQEWLLNRGISKSHLSVSDETHYASAFVILEKTG